MSNARVRPLVLLLASLVTATAHAAAADPLQLYGQVGYGHDDNLLRVPDGQPGYGGTKADSWWEREGGLILDKSYRRQRISVVARLSKYDFDHFKQLDYDGKDLQATWFWQLGNRLEGKLGASYAQVLAPYTDFQSNARNLRRTHGAVAEAAWRPHAAWRVRAGLRRDRYDYELDAQRYNARTEDAYEAELDFLPAGGSTVGLVARRVDGRYPYLRQIGAALLANDFTQDELKLRALWLAGGATTVDALAGYTRRAQPSFGAGATSGVAGQVKASYRPHGKLAYDATVWRDFAPLESTVVSYTLNRGARIGVHWAARAGVQVDADASYERRAYNARAGLAGVGVGFGADDLRDAIHGAGLRATWAPRAGVQVTAGLIHQARSGSAVLGTGSFASNSLTLAASVQF